jgi:hypothetical protein
MASTSALWGGLLFLKVELGGGQSVLDPRSYSQPSVSHSSLEVNPSALADCLGPCLAHLCPEMPIKALSWF